MFYSVFRLFLGIREVCIGILRVPANETTAKMMVSINPGRHSYVKCRLH